MVSALFHQLGGSPEPYRETLTKTMIRPSLSASARCTSTSMFICDVPCALLSEIAPPRISTSLSAAWSTVWLSLWVGWWRCLCFGGWGRLGLQSHLIRPCHEIADNRKQCNQNQSNPINQSTRVVYLQVVPADKSISPKSRGNCNSSLKGSLQPTTDGKPDEPILLTSRGSHVAVCGHGLFFCKW